MLEITVTGSGDIVTVEPHGALAESDFKALEATVDPIIEARGKLRGILIHAESFPGWNSFAGFFSHCRFVEAHHDKVRKVALVTDSHLGDLAEFLGGFVDLEVRHFPYEDLDRARTWIEATEKA